MHFSGLSLWRQLAVEPIFLRLYAEPDIRLTRRTDQQDPKRDIGCRPDHGSW